ncbi:MAG: hypothetical protein M3014_06715 [Chloroflexota bacterium]|nr:hypothetical protein [Chloroflexota bacterium]
MNIFGRFKKRDITDPQGQPGAGISQTPDNNLAPGPGEAMVLFGGLNMH